MLFVTVATGVCARVFARLLLLLLLLLLPVSALAGVVGGSEVGAATGV